MKNKSIANLEQELVNLLSQNPYGDSLILFNLGVEFGRYFEREGIESYEPNVFKQRELEEKEQKEIGKRIDRIISLVKKLICASIRDLIAETGSWTIEKHHYLSSNLEKFSDTTVSKYQVQVDRVDMESYGGEFEVTLSVVGELGQKFRQFQISTMVTAYFHNDSGTEELTIFDPNSVENCMENLHVRASKNIEYKANDYDDFIEDISKPFLFLMLMN